MKKVFRFKSRFLVLASAVLLSAFVLTSCDKDKDDANDTTTYSLSGDASGSQVVPAVDGAGTATISGTYNSGTRVMTYTTNWSNLTGAPTSAGFYTGATGVNGTIVGTPWTLGTGISSNGSVSGQMTLTPEQATQLINGNWYYVIGTDANTAGEVRGQIVLTPVQ